MTKEELQDLARDPERLSKHYDGVDVYCDEPIPATKHLPPEERGSCDLEKDHDGEHTHFINSEAHAWSDTDE